MSLIDKLKRIKQVFEDVSWSDYQLEDDRSLSITALEVGGQVELEGAVAPDGEYVFKDGTKVTVADGLLTAVVEPEGTVDDVILSTYKLTDSTEISIDNLAEGGFVTIAGNPAPAGEHVLEDGTKLTVDETGKIVKIEVAGVDISPEAMKAALQKFASGTPEERIANLEIVAKALMEYNYGYELRKGDADAAIAVYKQGLEKVERELADTKKVNEKQAEIITGMFEIVEELTKESTDNPPPVRKKMFSHISPEFKDTRVSKYAAALESLREKEQSK